MVPDWVCLLTPLTFPPQDELTNFLLVLALCHSVIPEVGEEGVVYHASSPDEEALIKAARELGVFFKARTPEAVIVEVVSECL